jgi:hypothetical protein
MTGARATSGEDGPRWADWCDRVGDLKGVAWGPIMKSGVSDPSDRREKTMARPPHPFFHIPHASDP